MSDTGNSDGGTNDPGAPISVLGNTSMPSQWSVGDDGADAADTTSGLTASPPGILGDAFNPKPWTLADSTIHAVLSPDDIKTIDFGDDGSQGQGSAPGVQRPPSQPDDNAPKTVQPPDLPDLPDIDLSAATFQAPTLPNAGPASSTLDYDDATHRLTLTRSDGTVQTFPANNNVDSKSKGH